MLLSWGKKKKKNLSINFRRQCCQLGYVLQKHIHKILRKLIKYTKIWFQIEKDLKSIFFPKETNLNSTITIKLLKKAWELCLISNDKTADIAKWSTNAEPITVHSTTKANRTWWSFSLSFFTLDCPCWQFCISVLWKQKDFSFYFSFSIFNF